MAIDRFYTKPPQAVDGSIAFAVDVNGINDEAYLAFTEVASELDGQIAAVSAWTTLAQEWAEEAEDVEVTVCSYSALHWAAKAEELGAAQVALATDQVTLATGFASDAEDSAIAAASSYDSFDDRYLGVKASDPTLDNDGDALVAGALYFQTGTGMKVYSGTVWEAAYLPASAYATLTGAETLTNKTLGTSAYTQIADASLGTGTHTFNYTDGDMQQLTATGDITIAFSNFVTGKVCTMIIDAVNWGDFAITHPAVMLFASGTAPTYTAGGTDRLLVVKDKDDVFSLFVIGQAIGVVV